MKTWIEERELLMSLRGWILLIVPLTAGLSGCERLQMLRGGAPADEKASLNEPVSTARKSVSALGRLEPSSRVVNIGTQLQDRVERLLVEEGGRVEAGADLVFLATRDERIAEKERIEAELRASRKRLAAEEEYHSALIVEAKLRQKQIEILRPLEIAAQEATLRSLQAELATSQKDLTRQKNLQANNSASQQELDRQQLAVHVAEEKLQSATKELDRLKASWELDREVSLAAVKSAEAASARALANVPVEELEKQIELAESRLVQTVLKAPFKGQVLKVLKRPGEIPNIQKGDGILQLASTDTMHAVAEVYESDVRLVRVGQRATIRSPALDQELSGRVVEIGVQIFKNDVLDVDPASDTDSRVVEVRILLDESKPASGLTNLQVDVKIDLEGSVEERSAALDRPAK